MINQGVSMTVLAALLLGGFYFYGNLKYKECENDNRVQSARAYIEGASEAQKTIEDAQMEARATGDADLDRRLRSFGVMRD